ncbi:hypothetical protein [Terrimonas ginsenosidimutans]|uniref:hypothetical protein n=1 Tax=Terrimonas ginsenosidimutans TaxID=2908004 RepID=UPI003D7ADC55
MNTVQPGSIDTEMNPDGTEFSDKNQTWISARQICQAEEIPAVVAFLASEKASLNIPSIPAKGSRREPGRLQNFRCSEDTGCSVNKLVSLRISRKLRTKK